MSCSSPDSKFGFLTYEPIAEPVHHLGLVQVRLVLGAETEKRLRLADRRTGLHRETVVCAEWTSSSCAYFDPFAVAGGCARAHEFAIDDPPAEG
jgi:hypothetical protein